MSSAPSEGTGYTVRDLARRWRVGPDKVRAFIREGTLRAVNLATTRCGKPQWRVTPDAVEEFERGRTSTPPPPKRARRRKTATADYYPGD